MGSSPRALRSQATLRLLLGGSLCFVLGLLAASTVNQGTLVSNNIVNESRIEPTPAIPSTIPIAKLRPWDHPSALARRHSPNDFHKLPRTATTLEEFLLEIKQALDVHQLIMRPVEAIFSNTAYYSDIPHPACRGLWMEFGVFMGATLNTTAEFRERYCGMDSGPVYGFDTFTGLPEQWSSDFQQGAFSLGGRLPPVRQNIELVKGLFSDSVPSWVQSMREKFGGSVPPITYLHVDCDLYQGTKDIFSLLGPFIAPGCVLIFDELLHYPDYRNHEVKAFWEWLQVTGRKVAAVGMAGPIDGTHLDEAVDLDLQALSQKDWKQQSAAFVVL